MLLFYLISINSQDKIDTTYNVDIRICLHSLERSIECNNGNYMDKVRTVSQTA